MIDEKDPTPEEVEEATGLTKEQQDLLIAIGDRFGSLVKDKKLSEIVKPGDMYQASELFVQSTHSKVGRGAQDLVTALLLAVAWGIYVAEQHQSNLTDDLTNLQ